jgi:ketosteroid isomerase-like protein
MRQEHLPSGVVHALIRSAMPCRTILLQTIVCFAVGLLFFASCKRSPQSQSPQPSQQQAVTAPADLQHTVDQLVHAAETFDIPHLLDVYADDFVSGTGRSKEGVAKLFSQFKENHVRLQVEKSEFEKIENGTALLRTRLRLRYMDRFRDLGEGEVVITDVLRHSLRKEATGWKIYADERVSTYREGRFGAQPPTVQLETPDRLPTGLEYPVTVTVRREKNTEYQVMVGNYVEDPAILPPPDIVTPLPDDGVLHAHLLPNPQGRSEMVRITVIAAALDGHWVGATIVSKFVPGAPLKKKEMEDEQEFTAATIDGKERT